MEWYEAEVRALEQARKPQRSPLHPVVFYGSSSLRLWDSLASDLGEPDTLNLAFGGSTLAACVHFFDRLITPLDPASLVVYAGDNDLGDGRKPEEVLQSFVELAGKVARLARGMPFGFISIKPSPARVDILDRIRLTNAWIREEIERIPDAYMIDVFPPMLDSKGVPRRELFLEDGLHMNRAGYLLWLEVLEPYRHRIFTRG
ncbi:GDSL-type esterase/lipase family protein [Paludibaculum fermentans]|uniref:GDSL family lipase n=1 Tax=Paludibaculum fermentans TaxID=1473598 RepID=A0A7S7NV94_PALFE|nr:GDSL-type esterase/lipase family protein [Paludibaculum fermentans]QOY90390.1 GDSL family lipase [Paludibaculum fermentans]